MMTNFSNISTETEYYFYLHNSSNSFKIEGCQIFILYVSSCHKLSVGYVFSHGITSTLFRWIKVLLNANNFAECFDSLFSIIGISLHALVFPTVISRSARFCIAKSLDFNFPDDLLLRFLRIIFLKFSCIFFSKAKWN